MFRGLYEHAIDAKGRTSLPARLRDSLGDGDGAADRLIITTGLDRCLVAFAPGEWRAFEEKLAALSQFDPAVVQLKRIYVAGATECPVDKHGRILIPPLLREYAALKTQLVWAGMVTTIEIWSKERWLEQSASSRADPTVIARALTELGL
jgi:MraZ protein